MITQLLLGQRAHVLRRAIEMGSESQRDPIDKTTREACYRPTLGGLHYLTFGIPLTLVADVSQEGKLCHDLLVETSSVEEYLAEALRLSDADSLSLYDQLLPPQVLAALSPEQTLALLKEFADRGTWPRIDPKGCSTFAGHQPPYRRSDNQLFMPLVLFGAVITASADLRRQLYPPLERPQPKTSLTIDSNFQKLQPAFSQQLQAMFMISALEISPLILPKEGLGDTVMQITLARALETKEGQDPMTVLFRDNSGGRTSYRMLRSGDTRSVSGAALVFNRLADLTRRRIENTQPYGQLPKPPSSVRGHSHNRHLPDDPEDGKREGVYEEH